MNEFARMLARMAEDGDDDNEESHILPEAEIEDLKLLFADYQRGAARFKPGDLVTPKKGHNQKGHGRPHIVIEVLPDAMCDMTLTDEIGPGSFKYGNRHNVRVACRMLGDLICFWMEAHTLEPYSA